MTPYESIFFTLPDTNKLFFHNLIYQWINSYFNSYLNIKQSTKDILEQSWIQFHEREIHQFAFPLMSEKIVILFVHSVRLAFKDAEMTPILYELIIDTNKLNKMGVRLFRINNNDLKLVMYSDSSKLIGENEKICLMNFPNTSVEIQLNIFKSNHDLLLKIEDRGKSKILELILTSPTLKIDQSSVERSIVNPSANLIKNPTEASVYEIPHLIDEVIKDSVLGGFQKGKSNFIQLMLDPETIRINERTNQIDYRFGELIACHCQPEEVENNKQKSLVIGIQTHDLGIGIPIKRLLIIGDFNRPKNATISAIECTQINAAIRYAHKQEIPIDWFPISYGVEISYDQGVENLDASASTAREIIKHAGHYGVPINIVVNAENIGAQAYWNALATIIQESRGILIMTDEGSMTLTGHKALVSALLRHLHSLDISNYTDKLFPEGLKSLGGYKNIYGPNTDAMLKAKDLKEACYYLMLHHYYSYSENLNMIASCRPLEKTKKQTLNLSKINEEIAALQMGFSLNRENILEFIRDPGSIPPLRFWSDAKGIQHNKNCPGNVPQTPTTIVQEMMIGGQPMMVIFPPIGPLTPFDSLIIAKAIYKANSRLPVLIIGNLMGFNSDPLAMELSQLRFGASIIRSIVNHHGPIIVVNLGNLIGGSYVIFSKQLNSQLRILALEGARIQVIGGHVATKVVFHKRILKQAQKLIQEGGLQFLLEKNQQDTEAIEQKHSFKIDKSVVFEESSDYLLNRMNQILRQTIEDIEMQECLAYDQYHTVERALKLQSIDEIVKVKELKEAIYRHCRDLLNPL